MRYAELLHGSVIHVLPKSESSKYKIIPGGSIEIGANDTVNEGQIFTGTGFRNMTGLEKTAKEAKEAAIKSWKEIARGF
jgi:hypothetical protein